MKSAFRIGQGYDVHRLAEGLRLRLCGVDVPHSKGCVAHSDGDVAVHALCDALLGSVALGDIGRHFPDNDDRYLSIDSMVLLERTVGLVGEQGYGVVNVDLTIAAQQPRLAPFVDQMRSRLAETLKIDRDAVSVKATTTEHLGFEGREEGISAMAVVLVERL